MIDVRLILVKVFCEMRRLFPKNQIYLKHCLFQVPINYQRKSAEIQSRLRYSAAIHSPLRRFFQALSTSALGLPAKGFEGYFNASNVRPCNGNESCAGAEDRVSLF